MARQYARITTAIWQDDDWVRLPADTKLVYLLLLSQARLTLAGTLDIKPAPWSTLLGDRTPEDVNVALDTLHEHGFVILDRSTGELAIRRFTRHDLEANRVSAPVAKGFWSAWEGTFSIHIRQQVVDNCPASVWDKLTPHAPPEALQMRRSSPLKREPASPLERKPDAPVECPSSSIQQPAVSSTVSAPLAGAARAETKENRNWDIASAVADQLASHARDIRNRPAWIAKTTADVAKRPGFDRDIAWLTDAHPELPERRIVQALASRHADGRWPADIGPARATPDAWHGLDDVAADGGGR